MQVDDQGEAEEKAYKDYRVYPHSLRFRLITVSVLLVLFTAFSKWNPRERYRQNVRDFFDFMGVPGGILICLLLLYALFRVAKARKASDG